MKSYKKMSQNQLIGLLTLLFVVVLGVGLYIAYTPEIGTEEEAFDPNETPPLVQIDAGYNATLSGEPFYIVDDSDEDFDDSLDVCKEFGTDSYRRGVQNGWYQVVAYEDDMTVEEVIFEQVDLEEGDKMVAVVYDAEDQEWKAWPNRIIVDKNGNNVELLDRDDELDKGTVVSVSADRDVDYCSDYAEIGDHENIELRWNLVSRPDFNDVDYRTIWEVAFAKGGNSGVDLERYYSSDDPSNSTPPNQLPDDQLYWVYGGEASAVTDGGTLDDEKLACDVYEIRVEGYEDSYPPAGATENLRNSVGNSLDEQPWLYKSYDNYDEFKAVSDRLEDEGVIIKVVCLKNPDDSDEQRIVVKVNNTNAAGQRDVVEGETFKINEDGGELRYSVGLAKPADGNVELEFEIYEDTQLVAVEAAEEIASRTTAGGGAFARGKNYSDGESTLTAFVLEAIDDDSSETPKAVEFRVVDKAGNLDDVRFNIEVLDDDANTVDIKVTVKDASSGDLLPGANVVVAGNSTGSTTNVDGIASLTGVSSNSKLTVSFTGYDSKTVNVSTANSAGEITVELEQTETDAPELAAQLNLVASTIDSNRFVELKASDSTRIKEFDLSKITIDQKLVDGNTTIYEGSFTGDQIEGVLVNGDVNNGYEILRLKLNGEDWKLGGEYRISSKSGAVTYVNDKVNLGSDREFKVNGFTMMIEDTFSISGRGFVVTGEVLLGTASANKTAELVCGSNSYQYEVLSIEGRDDKSEYLQGEVAGVLLEEEASDQIICN